MPPIERAARRRWTAAIAIAVASLGLISFVDNTAWSVAKEHAPSLMFVGRYRLTSLAVCLVLYVAVEGRGAFRLPPSLAHWKRTAPVALMWTLGTAVAILGLRIWTPTLNFRGPADYAAFLGTGLLGEELLFRGALFGLLSRLLPESKSRLGSAVWITAVLFALAHLQYHGFHLTSSAALQVLYTIPAGLVLAFIRRHSASVWPGIVVHVICNLLSVVRSDLWTST